MKGSVAIIHTCFPHYRVPVFEGLWSRLAEYDIELILVYSEPSSEAMKRNDSGYLKWSTIVNDWSGWIGGIELYWQSALSHVTSSDLLIILQENRLLLNYLLFMRKSFVNQKLAFGGHGKTMQRENYSLSP